MERDAPSNWFHLKSCALLAEHNRLHIHRNDADHGASYPPAYSRSLHVFSGFIGVHPLRQPRPHHDGGRGLPRLGAILQGQL